MKIISKSFAKINLFLEIIGKNSNNYHIIDSLMTFIDIYDIIEVEKLNLSSKKESGKSILTNSKINLEITGEQNLNFLGKKENNILIKTANLMAEKFNFIPNIKIKLEKNIPIAAGLGGGSTNAATLIEILIKLYNLKIPKQQLQEIALKIGSDVPFCLHKKIAKVGGIGEKITDIAINQPNLYLLIINPNIPIDTGKIFQNYKFLDNKTEYKQENDLISIIKTRKNHLQTISESFCPQISQILTNLRLQRNIVSAKLSGSGATCFGVFNEKQDLELAFNNLKDIFPDFYIKKTILIYNIRP